MPYIDSNASRRLQWEKEESLKSENLKRFLLTTTVYMVSEIQIKDRSISLILYSFEAAHKPCTFLSTVNNSLRVTCLSIQQVRMSKIPSYLTGPFSLIVGIIFFLELFQMTIFSIWLLSLFLGKGNAPTSCYMITFRNDCTSPRLFFRWVCRTFRSSLFSPVKGHTEGSCIFIGTMQTHLFCFMLMTLYAEWV